MPQREFLVIDVGTSSIKAAVMNDSGEVIAADRTTVDAAGAVGRGFVAQDWLVALQRTVPELVADRTIAALAISGNGPTVVAVDEAGTALGEPLLWLDTRRAGPTGGASYYLGKVRWLYERHGAAARWFLPFPEYLIYALTGCAVAICPSPEFAPYIWQTEEVASYGVPSELLPPFVDVAGVVAGLSRDGAALLGLPRGTPVVAAGSDFLMSLVGTNCMEPGRTCDRAGTSEGINHSTEQAVATEGLRTLPHVRRGLYNVAGILSSTGLLFEWFRRISGQGQRDYDDMMRDIVAVADRGLPWFFPSLQSGASQEFRHGMFIELGAEHDRAAMGRAVVLAIGFSVRTAIERLRDAGCSVDLLTACGGQAKNRIWTQMKADICGVPIEVPRVADAELSGNLATCLVATGVETDLVAAAQRVVRIATRYQPDREQTQRYDTLYRRYTQRYARFVQALEECLADPSAADRSTNTKKPPRLAGA